ncbi:chromosome segregation protein SMC [Gracilaria domingensis]|nr:chromosome segregation protein SMC [Gracilaria domingensis]
MPRRARRPNAGEANSSRAPANEHAISARIQATFKKIIVALQDQRDLRCDLASTRARALVLDSEFVVLHTEFDRSVAARDKLDALSRELMRRNKLIDEEAEQRILDEKKMTEDIVQRFNNAMTDINRKLNSQSRSREQRDRYISILRNKLRDLRERYDMREQHFKQQIHRKHLEQQLAVAKHRELVEKHSKVRKQLCALQADLQALETQQQQQQTLVDEYRCTIQESERYLQSTEQLFHSQKTEIEDMQAEAKQLQSTNATARNTNNSTNVHIKAMESECKRLEASITQKREVERKERTKIEALEKLCKQVTKERTELHSEILVMQDAWSNLKEEIEALKDQVGESSRIFEALQSIMNREPDVAGRAIIRIQKAIDDASSDELSRVRLVSGSKLDEQLPLTATTSKPGPSNGIRPPG